MNPDLVGEYLTDFQKKDLPTLVEREIRVDVHGKIASIIGPRRAGKTYFLYQKIKELLNSGVPKGRVVYLNFEDPRLADLSARDFREILKLHWQLYPFSAKGILHLFIDEPQKVPGWETAVRALHDEGYPIFLTGSSSKLLSKEIATSLRGRTIPFTLLPCSFREFLKMKGKEFGGLPLGSKETAVLLGLLDEYLAYGGFPEVVKENNPEMKLRILQEYFSAIIYNDIVERYKIRNTSLIKWFMRSLSSSFSKELSVHKVYSTLESCGVKASKNTLYSYLSMLEDALFVFLVPKFSYSIRKRELSISKAYLCDTGFTRLVETGIDRGRRMENVVFLELERRKPVLGEIFYWKNPQKEEVDFVLKKGGGAEALIQVCADIHDLDVRKRELRALLKASEELNCNNLFIITWDYEASETRKGKTIRITPLWKWLLEKPKKSAI